MLVVVGEADWLPALDLPPLQAPEAVQERTLVAAQLKMAELPAVMELGATAKLRVAEPKLLTVIETAEDVVVLFAASRAAAVIVCVPFDAVVVFQLIE